MDSVIINRCVKLLSSFIWATPKEVSSLKNLLGIPQIYGKQAQSRGWILIDDEWDEDEEW